MATEKKEIKFHENKLEEQETHIWIDYLKRKVIIYTNRVSAYRRFVRKIGEPQKTNLIKGKIADGMWEINFEDKKKISSVLNRSALVGVFN